MAASSGLGKNSFVRFPFSFFCYFSVKTSSSFFSISADIDARLLAILQLQLYIDNPEIFARLDAASFPSTPPFPGVQFKVTLMFVERRDVLVNILIGYVSLSVDDVSITYLLSL